MHLRQDQNLKICKILHSTLTVDTILRHVVENPFYAPRVFFSNAQPLSVLRVTFWCVPETDWKSDNRFKWRSYFLEGKVKEPFASAKLPRLTVSNFVDECNINVKHFPKKKELCKYDSCNRFALAIVQNFRCTVVSDVSMYHGQVF